MDREPKGSAPVPWPELRLDDWRETYETLHRWVQVVGKVRLALSPSLNHTWHVALHPTARGLTTRPMAYGPRAFEVQLDLVEHRLLVQASDGAARVLPLRPQSVAAFHREFLDALDGLGFPVALWTTPVEIAEPIPFEEDERHATYEPAPANRFFRALLQAHLALEVFQGRFQGKQSPSHFFWGGFDLAQTRFTGRRAPLPAHADWLRRECYAHECLSFGFWPGTPELVDASFYAYAVPEPPGFGDAVLTVEGATYDRHFSEFLLPYESVRHSPSPRETLLRFYQEVYEVGAELGGWDRAALDRHEPTPPVHHLSGAASASGEPAGPPA